MSSIIVMGRMDNGKSAPSELLKTASYESLTPEIVDILPDGRVLARSVGVGRILITIGNLKKVISINVKPDEFSNLLYLILSERVVSIKNGEQIKIAAIDDGENPHAKLILLNGKMTDNSDAVLGYLQSGISVQSNNEAVLSVNGDLVTANQEGFAQIKVTVDGVHVLLSVNVEPGIGETITFDTPEVERKAYQWVYVEFDN